MWGPLPKKALIKCWLLVWIPIVLAVAVKEWKNVNCFLISHLISLWCLVGDLWETPTWQGDSCRWPISKNAFPSALGWRKCRRNPKVECHERFDSRRSRGDPTEAVRCDSSEPPARKRYGWTNRFGKDPLYPTFVSPPTRNKGKEFYFHPDTQKPFMYRAK